MNKQKKSNRKKYKILRPVLALAVSAFCLTTLVFLVSFSGLHRNNQTGLLDDSQIHTGEDLHTSLDLRLAMKASYPSSALGLVKDLGTEKGVTTQIVSYKVTADGLTEYALVMKPANAPTNGYPALILCHGYINPKEYDTTLGYLNDMRFYASNGIMVIKPDFRGQGLSASQGKSNSAYYSMVYNTDIMSLISSLKDTKYVEKNNINLWGHSMGAYIALRASVISKDIKHTIILSGPVASLKQMYLAYIPPSDENNPLALKTRQAVFTKYGTPGEGSNFWKYASPSSFISQSSTGYQIHVGELDTVVPPQMSADFDSQLTSLHHSHEYFVYPGGRHNLLAQRNLIWNRSLAYLKQTN